MESATEPFYIQNLFVETQKKYSVYYVFVFLC